MQSAHLRGGQASQNRPGYTESEKLKKMIDLAVTDINSRVGGGLLTERVTAKMSRNGQLNEYNTEEYPQVYDSYKYQSKPNDENALDSTP